jgi:hypothetical protein
MARRRKPEREIAVSKRFGQRLLQNHIHRIHQFSFLARISMFTDRAAPPRLLSNRK